VDVPLIATFAFWFLGNYYYNIWNKQALKVRKLGIESSQRSLPSLSLFTSRRRAARTASR
jgi:hypothetical protein